MKKTTLKAGEFSRSLLAIDAAATADAICKRLAEDVFSRLHKRGVVIGISGGVDSSVCLGLAARALGPQRVVALLLPEHESSGQSELLAREVAAHFKVENVLLENLSPALEGFGCYERRNAAIKRAFPDFDPKSHAAKIVLPSDILERETLNVYSLAIVNPDGSTKLLRLKPVDFLQIMAASNFKQRSRMSMLFYHAELRNFAVLGTANRHEHQQGFFVKYGDGGSDLMPIAHLYKCQVYQLAEQLELPEQIVHRVPTAETYSAEATQAEFFFQLDFELLDPICFGMDNGYAPHEVAAELGLQPEQVARVYRTIARKISATNYLRMHPLMDYPLVSGNRQRYVTRLCKVSAEL